MRTRKQCCDLKEEDRKLPSTRESPGESSFLEREGEDAKTHMGLLTKYFWLDSLAFRCSQGMDRAMGTRLGREWQNVNSPA